MAYGLPVLGGFVADRFLGTHRALVIGAFIIAAGHFMLAVPAMPTFFVGLALVAIGTGFFKVERVDDGRTALSAGRQAPRRRLHHLLHGRQRRRVPRPDRVRLPGESPRWGWHWGFGAAGVGMLLGLAMYLALRRKYLAGIGEVPNRIAAAADEPPGRRR